MALSTSLLILGLLTLATASVTTPEGCRSQPLFPRVFYQHTFNPDRTETRHALNPITCVEGARGSKITVNPHSIVHEAIGTKYLYIDNAFFDGWGRVPQYLEISFAQNANGSLDKNLCFAKVNDLVYRYSLHPGRFEQWVRRMQALVQQFVEGRCPIAGRKMTPELMGVTGSLDTLASLFGTYTCINILT